MPLLMPSRRPTPTPRTHPPARAPACRPPRRQAQHFELVFAAAKRAGWISGPDSPATKIDHVGFGLVLGEDGKKFKCVWC